MGKAKKKKKKKKWTPKRTLDLMNPIKKAIGLHVWNRVIIPKSTSFSIFPIKIFV
jgi:hypothetical protein